MTCVIAPSLFQHTAARRRLGLPVLPPESPGVSTHSRPKAAGQFSPTLGGRCTRFNTQPPEGGWEDGPAEGVGYEVSTHSRPKAAGSKKMKHVANIMSFNTQPPEGGWWIMTVLDTLLSSFQHTAARRRLALNGVDLSVTDDVSTHSRPKAAGPAGHQRQPVIQFQHTAARRRLARSREYAPSIRRFNTQPPEGGWNSNTLLIETLQRFQHTAARRRLGRQAT